MNLEKGNEWVASSVWFGEKAKNFLNKNALTIAAVIAFTGYAGNQIYDRYQLHQWEEQYKAYIEKLQKDAFSYTVQSGDTPSELITRLGMSYNGSTMDDFCVLNPQFANTLVGEPSGNGKRALDDLKVWEVIKLWWDSEKLNGWSDVYHVTPEDLQQEKYSDSHNTPLDWDK